MADQKMMSLDDEDAFLYGDEDEDAVIPVQAPAPSVKTTQIAASAPGEPEDEDDDEPDEEEESDDDLEIILDVAPGTVPQRPPPKRPPVVIRPVAPAAEPVKASPAPAPAPDVTPDPTAPPLAEEEGQEPEEEGAIDEPEPPKPLGLVPLGSLVPLTSYPAFDANIDVNAVQKDEFGNDLFDLDIDELEEKPWRQPGANMADYFNYGMNEQAWKNYALKQRKTRLTESAERNPYSAFASSDLQEAWQSLAPEHKATMMAAIMGFQPGTGAMMPPMMGMSAPMGMPGLMSGFPMPGMPGGGMPGMPNGGMPGMSNGGMPGMSSGGMGMMPHGGFSGGMEMYGTSQLPPGPNPVNGGSGNGVNGFESPTLDAGATPMEVKMENGDASASIDPPKTAATPRAALPPPRGIPTGPRVPATIPTGPRKAAAPPPTGPRRDRDKAYQDKDRDRQDRVKDEGLDYGAEATASSRPSLPPPRRRASRSRSRSPVARRTDRSRSPPRRNDRDREKERERERDRERTRDRPRRDRDDEERRVPASRDRSRERSPAIRDKRRDSRDGNESEASRRPTDEPVKAEEPVETVSLKIRGTTKAVPSSPDDYRKAPPRRSGSSRDDDDDRNSKRGGVEKKTEEEERREIEERRRNRRQQWADEEIVEDERTRKRGDGESASGRHSRDHSGEVDTVTRKRKAEEVGDEGRRATRRSTRAS